MNLKQIRKKWDKEKIIILSHISPHHAIEVQRAMEALEETVLRCGGEIRDLTETLETFSIKVKKSKKKHYKNFLPKPEEVIRRN